MSPKTPTVGDAGPNPGQLTPDEILAHMQARSTALKAPAQEGVAQPVSTSAAEALNLARKELAEAQSTPQRLRDAVAAARESPPQLREDTKDLQRHLKDLTQGTDLATDPAMNAQVASKLATMGNESERRQFTANVTFIANHLKGDAGKAVLSRMLTDPSTQLNDVHMVRLALDNDAAKATMASYPLDTRAAIIDKCLDHRLKWRTGEGLQREKRGRNLEIDANQPGLSLAVMQGIIRSGVAR